MHQVRLTPQALERQYGSGTHREQYDHETTGTQARGSRASPYPKYVRSIVRIRVSFYCNQRSRRPSFPTQIPGWSRHQHDRNSSHPGAATAAVRQVWRPSEPNLPPFQQRICITAIPGNRRALPRFTTRGQPLESLFQSSSLRSQENIRGTGWRNPGNRILPKSIMVRSPTISRQPIPLRCPSSLQAASTNSSVDSHSALENRTLRIMKIYNTSLVATLTDSILKTAGAGHTGYGLALAASRSLQEQMAQRRDCAEKIASLLNSLTDRPVCWFRTFPSPIQWLPFRRQRRLWCLLVQFPIRRHNGTWAYWNEAGPHSSHPTHHCSLLTGRWQSQSRNQPRYKQRTPRSFQLNRAQNLRAPPTYTRLESCSPPKRCCSLGLLRHFHSKRRCCFLITG